MTLKKVKTTVHCAVFLFILYLIIYFLGIVFNPQRSMLSMPNEADVLFLGSSFLYCAVSPMEIYSESGITSYVLGGPNQSMGSSYALLRAALRSSHPSVVVLEIKGLTFIDEQNNDITPLNAAVYNHVLLAPYFRLTAAFSGRKIDGASPFYDFFTYHYRWTDVTLNDFTESVKHVFSKPMTDTLKGYVVVNGTAEAAFDDEFVSPLHPALETNAVYLRLIYELCRDREIELIVLVTPSMGITYYDNYILYVRENYPDMTVINLNGVIGELELTRQDFFDGGHLNFNGAVKVSRYLSNSLATIASLPDRRNDPDFAKWNEDLIRYYDIVS